MIEARAENQSSNAVLKIPVVGIVGGIGSGKSAVADWVGTHANALVLNADQLGHEALKSPEVIEALRQRFGNEILSADGSIDRKAVASQVFGIHAEQLTARHDLEKIVHPEIGRRIVAGIESAERENKSVVLVDAAVLLESGWRNECDLVVYVDTPDEIRLARVRANRGWSEEELRRREASQWSLADKRREADIVVTNDRELEYAGQQLLTALIDQGFIKSPTIN